MALVTGIQVMSDCFHSYLLTTAAFEIDNHLRFLMKEIEKTTENRHKKRNTVNDATDHSSPVLGCYSEICHVLGKGVFNVWKTIMQS